MLPDLMPIKHKIEGNDDIVLWLIGDVHIGAAEFDEKRLKRDIADIEVNPRARVVLLGDLINNGVKSSVTNVYEEQMMPSAAKKLAVQYLEPIKDKIIAAVGGNHEMRSVKEVDDDPAYDIMCKLNIEHLYRRNAAFVKVHLGKPDVRGKNNPTYSMFITHGSGGGSTVGASANKQHRTQAIYEGIDIFIQGHTHKAINFYPQRVIFDTKNNKILRRTITCVTAPSYLDYGGYAMRSGLHPATPVTSTLILRGDRKQVIAQQRAEY